MKNPKISFVIPTLGRPEGLQRCLDSINSLNYPQELIEIIVIVDEPRMGVPKRVNEGYKKSSGEYIVYGSNDCEFDKNSIAIACGEMAQRNKALLAFNTGYIGYDQGNICEHFIIKADFVEKELGGEIFDTDFNHIGVDNLLWAKCREKEQAMRSRDAIVHHHHFSTGRDGEVDTTYELGWKKEMVEKDRELLRQKLEKLYNNL